MRELDTGTNQLLASVDEHVATITLNRPDKRNALSDELTPALREVLLVVEADADVRVVVITGAGTAFCAGGDVSGMGGRSQRAAAATPAPSTTAAAPEPAAALPSLESGVRTLQHKQETLTLRLFELAKPTIAVLPGPAAGAGLSIALACDLRVAAERAFVTTAFANIGLSGDYGSSWLLSQLVGIARAKELFYTSRRVQSAEALSLGIFNEVVADGELGTRARELARSIACGPPIALRFMKENLNRAATQDLKTCLALEADRMVRCTRTADHKEAVGAFLGKRKPEFTGT